MNCKIKIGPSRVHSRRLRKTGHVLTFPIPVWHFHATAHLWVALGELMDQKTELSVSECKKVWDGRLVSNSVHDLAALAGAMTGPWGLLMLLYIIELINLRMFSLPASLSRWVNTSKSKGPVRRRWRLLESLQMSQQFRLWTSQIKKWVMLYPPLHRTSKSTLKICFIWPFSWCAHKIQGLTEYDPTDTIVDVGQQLPPESYMVMLYSPICWIIRGLP